MLNLHCRFVAISSFVDDKYFVIIQVFSISPQKMRMPHSMAWWLLQSSIQTYFSVSDIYMLSRGK